MDVKCSGCYKSTTVFSHDQTVFFCFFVFLFFFFCIGCLTLLHQPRGGKARLTEGFSFRRKQH
ncbi:40S ribosomal protein S27-like [Acinonyx jubatus]|uniref:40S ribosomal protein S27-like n=1 Tax=Acinonyx jubatus TaxID=32536 RepID=A0ABM3NG23_ACIJB|nr:40S ribosomal protein S27-like [Acinonyx jubatus]